MLVGKAQFSLKISPPGLTESEQGFVQDLRDYWERTKAGHVDDEEVFLLRNQSKGMGVGFFESSGFYPDFILWIKKDVSQRIVFVEPHGMLHEDAPEHSEKIQLHKKLRSLSKEMARNSSFEDITLDSYIVSDTPYEKLRKRSSGNWSRLDFAESHVLFREPNDDYEYMTFLLTGNTSESR